ncbi:hypothetical protein WDV85_03865 [Pseudokineococcus sp. 5B2Z-1]|uniref:hypothetical protein n=1 Tax=Pseudokineococcus sp. 5B2Z-1 TaxID=3132744 RepID=UPI0030AAF439
MTSPAPAPPPHEHLFHPGVADAGRAARRAGRPHLVGCAVCGRSVQLGVPDEAPRRPWPGAPTTADPAPEPGDVRRG